MRSGQQIAMMVRNLEARWWGWGGAGRGTGAWLVNGNVLWKYLNAMSVSMGAPAAGKSLKSVVRLVQSQLCSVAVRHHPEPSRQDSFIKA